MSRWLRETASTLLRPEVAVLAVGLIAFTVWLILQTVSPDTAHVEVQRVQGDDRYATAAQLAANARPNGTRSAILARGDDFADALAAAALVGPTNGVVLLTEANRVPDATKAALDDLNVGIVYLMGGSNAITDLVRTELAEDFQVLRLAGPDRFSTAAAVASEIAEREAVGILDGRATAFVVNGERFPDAVAAASPAAAGGFPILLTTTDRIPEATLTTLQALEIERVILVGGPAVIGSPVRLELQQGGYVVEEISGEDRSATAAALADRFVSSTVVLDSQTVVLARGDAFADALAAGSFAGTIGAPLLLTTGPEDAGGATLDFLRRSRLRDDLNRIVVVGGEAAVAPGTLDAAHDAAIGSPSTSSPTP